ncbi:MAG: uroporphyrinogen-III synthase [Alphaproteobacteria bacterium]|nr:uroporphyrinogen-III synthase [Alphaproteobacteria bacterium]
MILITRPHDQARKTALDLEQKGYKTFCEPMLDICPLEYAAPDLSIYNAIIFTSAQAVRLFGNTAPDANTKRIYCVGKQTHKHAKNLGFTQTLCAQGSAENLANLIIRNEPYGSKLLHVRGEDIAYDLSPALKNKGIICEPLILYKASPRQKLSEECVKKLQSGQISAATFYSARTAKIFMHLVKQEGIEDCLKNIKPLCISQTVLGCVQPKLWSKAYSAETPDRNGMNRLVEKVMEDQ